MQNVRIGTQAAAGIAEPPLPGVQNAFGTGLAVGEYQDGAELRGVLVVGAPGENYMLDLVSPVAPIETSVGSAYVFRVDINQVQEGASGEVAAEYTGVQLRATDGRPEARFGMAVAVHGTKAVVGAPGPISQIGQPDVADFKNMGAAYVFDFTTGEQLAKLFPRDWAGKSPNVGCYWFGAAVDIADGIVLVGAPRAKKPCSSGTKVGAAFSFSIPPSLTNTSWEDISPQKPVAGVYGMNTWPQTGIFMARERLTGERRLEFGATVSITTTGFMPGSPDRKSVV